MNDFLKKFISKSYKYDDSFTKDEFRNEVFKYLKDRLDVPSYIFDELTYSDVFRTNIPILNLEAKATIDYSRTIGYDRIEQWIETKTVKYNDGSRKVTTTPHSKTITDWYPDNGTLVGTDIAVGYDKCYSCYKDIINETRDKKHISILTNDEIDSIDVSLELVDSLENDICNKVFKNNITYPGNHVKNEIYNGKTEILDASIVLISIYSIKIKIRDKDIFIYTCSNGEINLRCIGEIPLEDDYEDDVNKVGEIITEKRKETKKTKMIYRLSFLGGISLFILLIVLGINFNLIFLIILSFIPLITGFIVGIRYFKITSKINKIYSKKVIDFKNSKMTQIQDYKNTSYEKFINNIN